MEGQRKRAQLHGKEKQDRQNQALYTGIGIRLTEKKQDINYKNEFDNINDKYFRITVRITKLNAALI